jgi:multiple sugar transport system permease protein
MSTTEKTPTGTPTTVTAPARITDRAKAERRLGWWLAGPAFVVMLMVTAYPIGQAVFESLFQYRLTDPDAREFNWFNNYWVILTDSVWWQAVGVTVT